MILNKEQLQVQENEDWRLYGGEIVHLKKFEKDILMGGAEETSK